MFHLIKKYSNRKLYDTLQKRFIRMEELAKLVINREEVRVEDSDSHIDLTPLAVSKALIKYMQSGHEIPKVLQGFVKRGMVKKVKKEQNLYESEEEAEDTEDSLSYLPAEIRLLKKSLDYLHAVIDILEEEVPYNKKLHDEFYRSCVEFEKRLDGFRKKHRIP